MKMINPSSKKIVKLVMLVLTSALIATASAATYKYMYIDGSVTISTGSGLKWIEGASAPAGTSIAGSTVTIDLPVQNGTPMNFTNCLYLKNQDGSGHSLMINITNDATPSLYDVFNIVILENSTKAVIDTLNVLTTTDYYSGTIDASAVWEMKFQVNAKSTASGSDTFDVQFRYE